MLESLPMSLTPEATPPHAELAEMADRHVWGHFSALGKSIDGMTIIERGEGCHVWDDTGKRYLDGLAGLYTTQVGYGRQELADAAATQSAQLGFFPMWTYAHPVGVQLAARLAKLAPGDLNRVFFTSGGSEAVESAFKLARQYFHAVGQPQRTKVISRNLAYHGTTMGALSITGLDEFKHMFEPLVPGAIKVANTQDFAPLHRDDPEAWSAAAAGAIEDAIVANGADTIAAVFLEPVQNAGGCFVPPAGYFAKVREICDRHGVLLVSDEVICAYGRLGYMFGSEALGYVPDIITSAKGLTSGHAPLGAMIVSDRLALPFDDTDVMFAHGFTFAGHPVSCAVAMANLDIIENDGLMQNVRDNAPYFAQRLEELRDLHMVADVRGMGYFYGIELVKDPETGEQFNEAEVHHLLRGFLSNRLAELGLLCRADSRGEPVIQLAPPLIAGREEIDEMCRIIHQALSEAQVEMDRFAP